MNQRGFEARIKLEQFSRAFYISLLIATIASNMARAEVPKTSHPTEANRVRIRFLSIEPTVLFIKDKSTLLQMVEVTIENFAEPV